MTNLRCSQIKYILPLIVILLADITSSFADNSKFIKEEIVIGKVTREFYVFIPSTAKEVNSPAIIAFHGYESNANAMRYLISPDLLAQEYGFVLVYPQGINNNWSVGTGNDSIMSDGDDFEFISQMIDILIFKYKINKDEIFSMGFSEGAQMSASYTCKFPGIIRAVGMVSYIYKPESCNFIRKVPIAVINSREDKIVLFDGGGNLNHISHDSAVSYFKTLNQTNPMSSVVVNKNTAKCISYKNMEENVEVIDCICSKGGHTWPGGNEINQVTFGKVNNDLNATEFFMKFFSKYCKEPYQTETGYTAVNELRKANDSQIKSITRYGFLVSDDLSIDDNREESEWQKILKGIKSSFSFKSTREKPQSGWDKLFDGFSGNFSFVFPIDKTETFNDKGSNSQGEPNNNIALNASIRYNPLSYWFAGATFFKYLSSDLQAPWHPDFTYSFGYDDWHPYTLSLVYSNYNGNRFNPNNDEMVTNFWEGSFALGWKFPPVKVIENLIKFHPTSGLGHKLSYNVVPVFYDNSTNAKKDWKQSISLYTKYTIYKSFYIDVNMFYYLNQSQQQPWDPDFNYTFGYFDWRAGTFSFRYNNYSGNRFFWRNRNDNTGRFSDGFFSIAWSWMY
jgi:poly(3-hydroxybutyrate) depolymerase